jgi:hypothetical protein
MKFLGAATFTDPLAIKDWKISTINAMFQNCANCGEQSGIEMHHLKHLRTLNLKLNLFEQKMAQINRKQVPLCRPCHLKVHQGTYAGMSLKHFIHIK